MELYTLKPTAIDLKNGRITKEESDLIRKFIRSRDAYWKHSHIMGKHFMEKYNPEITAAKNQDELDAIKEKLRWMPESVDKTLIFRTILMKEDELNS